MAGKGCLKIPEKSLDELLNRPVLCFRFCKIFTNVFGNGLQNLNSQR